MSETTVSNSRLTFVPRRVSERETINPFLGMIVSLPRFAPGLAAHDGRL